MRRHSAGKVQMFRTGDVIWLRVGELIGATQEGGCRRSDGSMLPSHCDNCVWNTVGRADDQQAKCGSCFFRDQRQEASSDLLETAR